MASDPPGILQSPALDPPIGTADWLMCAQKQLSQELHGQQGAQEEREQQLDACGETLQLLVDSIKGILSAHHRQLADVKHLLRAMAKVGPATLSTLLMLISFLVCVPIYTIAIGVKVFSHDYTHTTRSKRLFSL